MASEIDYVAKIRGENFARRSLGSQRRRTILGKGVERRSLGSWALALLAHLLRTCNCKKWKKKTMSSSRHTSNLVL